MSQMLLLTHHIESGLLKLLNRPFCCPYFSLLHSYFCSVVSGAHVAICVYLHFFLHLLGEASKGGESGKVRGTGTSHWGLGPYAQGSLLSSGLLNHREQAFPAGTRGTAMMKDCGYRTVTFSGFSPGLH